MTVALDRLFAKRTGLLVLYVASLAIYLATAGIRLRGPSANNHFAYLAHGWLHGKLSLAVPPPHENDWGLVEVLTLRDGRTVKGKFSKGGNVDRFYPLSGPPQTITPDQIAARTNIRYVTFPPFPAVLMLPLVAIFGLRTNDVLFSVVWAALNPVLLFVLLRELVRRGLSKRSTVDNLWLVAMFSVGSVYYYTAVTGQVWYTAHVIGVTCALLYAWASLDAARPALAGLAMGLGFATRTPMIFMFPLFLWEAVNAYGGWDKLLAERRIPAGLFQRLLRFAAPLVVVIAILFVHNHLRFQRFTEFGHTYLNIAWAERIQRWGLFNYHFLSRNLACALVLLPRILAHKPWVQVSSHGMSMFVTSPNLAYLFGQRERSRLTAALWLSVLATALPSLLYQNSGYIQFGYRFSLDYLVFLVMLLAVGNHRLGRLFKVLVIVAAAINLFGAITFDRYPEFTYEDSFFPHGNN